MINIIYDDQFLEHDNGYGHPERPERLTSIINALKKLEPQQQFNWVKPRKATLDELRWIHSDEHIQNVKSLSESGGGYADPDTYISPASYETALLSAGAWLDAVDIVVDKREWVFVLSRPPGHHAERNRAMGFCLFSNAALAAHYANKQKLISRVAIFDWDVHHGNGTQHILENDSKFGYCSMHQHPLYPGTGQSIETGKFNNVLNIPMSAGSAGSEYNHEFDQKVNPFIRDFDPDLFIISAGFDAARSDPLAGMNLEPDDFAHLLQKCKSLQDPLLIGLEGGYNLDVLSESIVKLVEVIDK
jgi:acetoin utilization deacetylase AcuC-like enzyme